MKQMSITLLSLFVLTNLWGCQSQPKADLLIYNGAIYTLDARRPRVEAVAVKNGKIIALGAEQELQAYRGQSTRLLDLQGATMTPGLIESHGHLLGMGYAKMQLDLSGARSYQEMIDMVAEAASKISPGEWILGRGWHQSKWNPKPKPMVRGFQTHQALSAVSPDNPVFLRHASGHAAIANAKAMEIAGITSASEISEDGEIIKDAQGNPTGIFTEAAMQLIARHIPQSTPESNRRALKLAIEECLRNGITSFRDAGADQAAIRTYRQFLENDGLTIRLYVMLSGSDRALLRDWFQRRPEIGSGNQHLTIRAIKLYADGALGSRGAWLLEPYSDRPGHSGNSITPPDTIYAIAKEALKHGFQVCTHAIGDRANREVLNAYERIFAETPELAKDHRFRIEHAQHLSKQDIPRFAQLGVIPAMQAIHMSSDRPWAINRLGRERIEEGAYVWQKLLQSGARIANGTDTPVEPINPLACFYASVARKTLQGQPPGGYEADQKMSREQALRSYTLDGAYAGFEETTLGSIEVGKLADFTVFSKDIMTIPEEEILNTEILYTIIDGKVVYQNFEF